MAALRDEASHHVLAECLARNDDSLRLGTPEMEEMSLAAMRWPMQCKGSGWPIGPPVYPAQRCGIAVRDQEIGAAQSIAAGQIEGELHRYSRTGIGRNQDRCSTEFVHRACSECARMRPHRSR